MTVFLVSLASKRKQQETPISLYFLTFWSFGVKHVITVHHNKPKQAPKLTTSLNLSVTKNILGVYYQVSVLGFKLDCFRRWWFAWCYLWSLGDPWQDLGVWTPSVSHLLWYHISVSLWGHLLMPLWLAYVYLPQKISILCKYISRFLPSITDLCIKWTNTEQTLAFHTPEASWH